MSSFPITVLSSKKFKNQNEYNNLLNAIAYQFIIDNSKSRDKYEGLMYLYSRLYFDVDDELKRNRFWSILSEVLYKPSRWHCSICANTGKIWNRSTHSM